MNERTAPVIFVAVVMVLYMLAIGLYVSFKNRRAEKRMNKLGHEDSRALLSNKNLAEESAKQGRAPEIL